MDDKVKKGKEGEKIACNYLIERGYKILEKNYHYGHGEIDIIAKDRDTLVFVEVKYRKSLEYGMPEDSITRKKQLQIRKIAEAYLYQNKIENQSCRIDVISILHLQNENPVVNHYIDVF